VVKSRHQNAGRNDDNNLLVATKSLENVAKFIRLGTTLIQKNCIHWEIKSRLNSGKVSTVLFGTSSL